MQGAWKVGLAVVIFVAMLAGAYTYLGISVVSPRRDVYFAEFSNVGGLTPGAKVLLSGVPVGQVTDVRLAAAGKAKIKLLVDKGLVLPIGTEAVLPSALIGVGEKLVELTPPPDFKGQLKPGATLKGRVASALSGMMPNAEQTIDQLNKTLLAAEKLLGDEGLKSQLGNLLQSAGTTATEFGKLAGQMNVVIAQNQAKLANLLGRGVKIMEDVGEISARMAALAKDGKLQKGLDGLLGKMDATLTSSHALVEDIRSTVNDPELKGNFKAIASNTKEMTQTGTGIAKNVEEITKNGITLSEKAIEIATKASELADDAKEVLQGFKKTIGGLGGATKGAKIDVSADLMREARPTHWRTDFNGDVTFAGKQYRIGLYDAFESNKLNAQAIEKFGKAEVRYGVFASKPGVGVEYPFAPQLSVRADVFGVNKTRFDLHGKLHLRGGIYGWLGIDKIFDKNAPSIGIGIKR